MSKELLNKKLINELFGKLEKIETNENVFEKILPIKKELSKNSLNKELITELFENVHAEEKKQCTFKSFVKILSLTFHTGKERIVKDGEFVYETERVWFTIDEAVTAVENYWAMKYEITQEEALKYLESLVAQGFFEKSGDKYHKLFFSYHLYSGVVFICGNESRLAEYKENS